MKPTEALTALEKEALKIVSEEAYALNADLVQASPVDTGAFRGAWQIKKVSKLKWSITNNMSYASVLWAGRRTVDGKIYGSLQWVDGGEPILKKTDNNINSRMKGIRK